MPYTYTEDDIGEYIVEFLVINKNKMKILLTGEEVERYALSSEAHAGEDARMRKRLWSILDAAERECGFSAGGEKVLIQYYPLAEGGELFVTKLGRIALGTERTLGSSANVTMLSSKKYLFKFFGLSDLISGVKSISEYADVPVCELYYADDGLYYLFFEERLCKGVLGVVCTLAEFGAEVPDMLIPYVREHSRKIAGHDVLARLREL